MEDVLDEWETAVQQLQTDPSGSASFVTGRMSNQKYKDQQFWSQLKEDRLSVQLLGLVIDLTNTSRYYQTTDLKKKGIKHVKIQCRGRDAVPENASVNTFVYEVSQFLLRQKSNKYILVHCTHGHNRIGYMIIHCLMRTQPMSVTRAIKFFFEARPPGIYKPDDIDALYAFYHERRPESLVCPPTPEWKRSSDLYLNGEATADDDDDDDDDGAPTALLVRGHAQFPGSHPVSLNRSFICLNTLIQDGKGMASVLYTYRSCVEALPQCKAMFFFMWCRGYVGIHSSGFRNFLLKPELLRSIVDSGFEYPFELRLGT
ncbi:uncharacterized protein [Gossypium hirsutum]|uniref:Uncharacterized protein isoform X3 n=1 Tax=Gossypium hirsutum TaxID=3635 RepID=A0ABM2YT79_GOSHI|nr:uncharacterized protein LOC107917880 isoform X3 [Gossypium hirsutum]